MGDLYHIYLNGEYLGNTIACCDEEAIERAIELYGEQKEHDYIVQKIEVPRHFQPRVGRRGEAW